MPGVFRANEARRIVPVALEGGRLRLQVPAGVIYDWLAYRRWVVEQELSIAGQAAIVVDLEVERGENSKGPN